MGQQTTRVVSPSEIAEMAGVSRAAVSNWRANDRSGFPAPKAGSEARPLFDLEEVTAWLVERDYTIRRDRGERRVWSLLNHFRGKWAIEEIVQALLAVLIARRLTADSPGVAAAWSDVVSTHQTVESLRRLSEVAERENSAWGSLLEVPREILATGQDLLAELAAVVNNLDPADLADIGDDALSRLTAAQGRMAGDFGHVGSRTSELLAALATGSDARVVYDPACGIAEALIRIWGTRRTSVQLIGHDINSAAVRTARQRCLLAGIDADIATADVLAYDPAHGLEADLVVAEPPFGMRWDSQQSLTDPRWAFGLPPRQSAEMAWIQHAVHHLKPGGRAYVITGRGTLFRGGAERAIRVELLRQGCVEAVIGLPGKMVPHTSIPLALWVLCRPGESRHPDTVLLVDATDVAEPEKHVASWLTLDAGHAPDEPPNVRVEVRDILAGDSLLQPQHWIGQPKVDAAEVEARFQASAATLAETIKRLGEQPALAEAVPAFAAARIVTIKDLAQQEVATLFVGREQPDPDADPTLVTPRVLREGLKEPRTEARSTPGLQADELTQPGDILITNMYEVRAVVDQHGGHRLARGVYRLRVDPTQCDPGYIAYSITGDRSRHQLAGTAIKRVDVKSLEIPLIPLAQQCHVVAMLNAARDAQIKARTISDAAGAFTNHLLDLIRYKHQ